MEDLKEALNYLVGLGGETAKTEVLQICGKTYATKRLNRYDEKEKAEPIVASSLTALVDYIGACKGEFPGDMLLHVVSPKEVRMLSYLDTERKRETLFNCKANTSEYRFDDWYDQERFIIELQANFKDTPDRAAILQVAGNVEAKTTATYGDDGMTQKTTIKSGVASLEDVIVPNPVQLIPYRTFLEVEQPSSLFVFRIQDKGGMPYFKLIEAEGGLWKSYAVSSIKAYLNEQLSEYVPTKRITVIG